MSGQEGGSVGVPSTEIKDRIKQERQGKGKEGDRKQNRTERSVPFLPYAGQDQGQQLCFHACHCSTGLLKFMEDVTDELE